MSKKLMKMIQTRLTQINKDEPHEHTSEAK